MWYLRRGTAEREEPAPGTSATSCTMMTASRSTRMHMKTGTCTTSQKFFAWPRGLGKTAWSTRKKDVGLVFPQSCRETNNNYNQSALVPRPFATAARFAVSRRFVLAAVVYLILIGLVLQKESRCSVFALGFVHDVLNSGWWDDIKVDLFDDPNNPPTLTFDEFEAHWTNKDFRTAFDGDFPGGHADAKEAFEDLQGTWHVETTATATGTSDPTPITLNDDFLQHGHDSIWGEHFENLPKELFDDWPKDTAMSDKWQHALGQTLSDPLEEFYNARGADKEWSEQELHDFFFENAGGTDQRLQQNHAGLYYMLGGETPDHATTMLGSKSKIRHLMTNLNTDDQGTIGLVTDATISMGEITEKLFPDHPGNDNAINHLGHTVKVENLLSNYHEHDHSALGRLQNWQEVRASFPLHEQMQDLFGGDGMAKSGGNDQEMTDQEFRDFFTDANQPGPGSHLDNDHLAAFYALGGKQPAPGKDGADEAVEALLKSIDTGTTPGDHKITVAEITDKWPDSADDVIVPGLEEGQQIPLTDLGAGAEFAHDMEHWDKLKQPHYTNWFDAWMEKTFEDPNYVDGSTHTDKHLKLEEDDFRKLWDADDDPDDPHNRFRETFKESYPGVSITGSTSSATAWREADFQPSEQASGSPHYTTVGDIFSLVPGDDGALGKLPNDDKDTFTSVYAKELGDDIPEQNWLDTFQNQSDEDKSVTLSEFTQMMNGPDPAFRKSFTQQFPETQHFPAPPILWNDQQAEDAWDVMVKQIGDGDSGTASQAPSFLPQFTSGAPDPTVSVDTHFLENAHQADTTHAQDYFHSPYHSWLGEFKNKATEGGDHDLNLSEFKTLWDEDKHGFQDSFRKQFPNVGGAGTPYTEAWDELLHKWGDGDNGNADGFPYNWFTPWDRDPHISVDAGFLKHAESVEEQDWVKTNFFPEDDDHKDLGKQIQDLIKGVDGKTASTAELESIFLKGDGGDRHLNPEHLGLFYSLGGKEDPGSTVDDKEAVTNLIASLKPHGDGEDLTLQHIEDKLNANLGQQSDLKIPGPPGSDDIPIGLVISDNEQLMNYHATGNGWKPWDALVDQNEDWLSQLVHRHGGYDDDEQMHDLKYSEFKKLWNEDDGNFQDSFKETLGPLPSDEDASDAWGKMVQEWDDGGGNAWDATIKKWWNNPGDFVYKLLHRESWDTNSHISINSNFLSTPNKEAVSDHHGGVFAAKEILREAALFPDETEGKLGHSDYKPDIEDQIRDLNEKAILQDDAAGEHADEITKQEFEKFFLVDENDPDGKVDTKYKGLFYMLGGKEPAKKQAVDALFQEFEYPDGPDSPAQTVEMADLKEAFGDTEKIPGDPTVPGAGKVPVTDVFADLHGIPDSGADHVDVPKWKDAMGGENDVDQTNWLKAVVAEAHENHGNDHAGGKISKANFERLWENDGERSSTTNQFRETLLQDVDVPGQHGKAGLDVDADTAWEAVKTKFGITDDEIDVTYDTEDTFLQAVATNTEGKEGHTSEIAESFLKQNELFDSAALEHTMTEFQSAMTSSAGNGNQVMSKEDFKAFFTDSGSLDGFVSDHKGLYTLLGGEPMLKQTDDAETLAGKLFDELMEKQDPDASSAADGEQALKLSFLNTLHFGVGDDNSPSDLLHTHISLEDPENPGHALPRPLDTPEQLAHYFEEEDGHDGHNLDLSSFGALENVVNKQTDQMTEMGKTVADTIKGNPGVVAVGSAAAVGLTAVATTRRRARLTAESESDQRRQALEAKTPVGKKILEVENAIARLEAHKQDGRDHKRVTQLGDGDLGELAAKNAGARARTKRGRGSSGSKKGGAALWAHDAAHEEQDASSSPMRSSFFAMVGEQVDESELVHQGPRVAVPKPPASGASVSTSPPPEVEEHDQAKQETQPAGGRLTNVQEEQEGAADIDKQPAASDVRTTTRQKKYSLRGSKKFAAKLASSPTSPPSATSAIMTTTASTRPSVVDFSAPTAEPRDGPAVIPAAPRPPTVESAEGGGARPAPSEKRFSLRGTKKALQAAQELRTQELRRTASTADDEGTGDVLGGAPPAGGVDLPRQQHLSGDETQLATSLSSSSTTTTDLYASAVHVADDDHSGESRPSPSTNLNKEEVKEAGQQEAAAGSSGRVWTEQDEAKLRALKLEYIQLLRQEVAVRQARLDAARILVKQDTAAGGGKNVADADLIAAYWKGLQPGDVAAGQNFYRGFGPPGDHLSDEAQEYMRMYEKVVSQKKNSISSRHDKWSATSSESKNPSLFSRFVAAVRDCFAAMRLDSLHLDVILAAATRMGREIAKVVVVPAASAFSSATGAAASSTTNAAQHDHQEPPLLHLPRLQPLGLIFIPLTALVLVFVLVYVMFFYRQHPWMSWCPRGRSSTHHTDDEGGRFHLAGSSTSVFSGLLFSSSTSSEAEADNFDRNWSTAQQQEVGQDAAENPLLVNTANDDREAGSCAGEQQGQHQRSAGQLQDDRPPPAAAVSFVADDPHAHGGLLHAVDQTGRADSSSARGHDAAAAEQDEIKHDYFWSRWIANYNSNSRSRSSWSTTPWSSLSSAPSTTFFSSTSSASSSSTSTGGEAESSARTPDSYPSEAEFLYDDEDHHHHDYAALLAQPLRGSMLGSGSSTSSATTLPGGTSNSIAPAAAAGAPRPGSCPYPRDARPAASSRRVEGANANRSSGGRTRARRRPSSPSVAICDGATTCAPAGRAAVGGTTVHQEGTPTTGTRRTRRISSSPGPSPRRRVASPDATAIFNSGEVPTAAIAGQPGRTGDQSTSSEVQDEALVRSNSNCIMAGGTTRGRGPPAGVTPSGSTSSSSAGATINGVCDAANTQTHTSSATRTGGAGSSSRTSCPSTASTSRAACPLSSQSSGSITSTASVTTTPAETAPPPLHPSTAGGIAPGAAAAGAIGGGGAAASAAPMHTHAAYGNPQHQNPAPVVGQQPVARADGEPQPEPECE
ncbi:unnamed protein product [Amoebophrya sp. A120]|nr:unnamed protein product [Amoebophrya sp. A120]|eukprot:GSA120T00012015001.1